MGPKTPAPTVLVVDDEAGIRQIARRILEDGGYEITEAEGGLEAIALLAQGHPLDLLIADLDMPGLGGDVARPGGRGSRRSEPDGQRAARSRRARIEPGWRQQDGGGAHAGYQPPLDLPAPRSTIAGTSSWMSHSRCRARRTQRIQQDGIKNSGAHCAGR